MTRLLPAALGLLVAVLPAAAQTPPEAETRRFLVAPLVGYGFGFSTDGNITARVQGWGEGYGYFEERVRGTMLYGATGEYRFDGDRGIEVGFGYSAFGNGSTHSEAPGGFIFEADGVSGSYWLGKAAFKYRIPETRIHAFAGPALVRLGYEPEEDTPDEFRGPINNVALDAGLALSFPLPIGARTALSVAAENFMIFWNTRELERRYDAYLSAFFGQPSQTTITMSRSNLPTLRLGVAMSF